VGPALQDEQAMKNTTSASVETFERQDLADSRLPVLSADSGCWQVRWPLNPGVARRPWHVRAGISVRKRLAIRPEADLPLQPGEAR
jgi:hypothetical protein